VRSDPLSSCHANPRQKLTWAQTPGKHSAIKCVVKPGRRFGSSPASTHP
jgi:hypothetical protein